MPIKIGSNYKKMYTYGRNIFIHVCQNLIFVRVVTFRPIFDARWNSIVLAVRHGLLSVDGVMPE